MKTHDMVCYEITHAPNDGTWFWECPHAIDPATEYVMEHGPFMVKGDAIAAADLAHLPTDNDYAREVAPQFDTVHTSLGLIDTPTLSVEGTGGGCEVVQWLLSDGRVIWLNDECIALYASQDHAWGEDSDATDAAARPYSSAGAWLYEKYGDVDTLARDFITAHVKFNTTEDRVND